jgi:transcriptional regulator with XRE-family HTH domain
MTGDREMPVFASVSLSDGWASGYNGHPMVPPRTLGQVFRAVRKAKGAAWTQTFVAKRAGFNKSTVNKIETDKPRVTDETKERVASVLGVTLDELKRSMHGVESPTVDVVKRTRNTSVVPLGAEETPTGERTEKDMRDDPDLEALLGHWRRLDFDQKGELLMFARKLAHRARVDPPGKALG